MQSNPPPQLVPNDYQKSYFESLKDSVFSIWFNSDRLTETLESELVNTTTSTETLIEIPLDDESVYHISSTILGIESGGGDRASYQITGTFYRSGGGATQQGSTSVDHEVESDAAWSAVYDTDGNNVRIRVTGNNSAWRCVSKVINLSN